MLRRIRPWRIQLPVPSRPIISAFSQFYHWHFPPRHQRFCEICTSPSLPAEFGQMHRKSITWANTGPDRPCRFNYSRDLAQYDAEHPDQHWNPREIIHCAIILKYQWLHRFSSVIARMVAPPLPITSRIFISVNFYSNNDSGAKNSWTFPDGGLKSRHFIFPDMQTTIHGLCCQMQYAWFLRCDYFNLDIHLLVPLHLFRYRRTFKSISPRWSSHQNIGQTGHNPSASLINPMAIYRQPVLNRHPRHH